MTDQIRLIVGLGNPGPEYEQTRHNAGFHFVDALAHACNADFKTDKKLFGDVARTHIGQHEVWLLKPMTFMNRSGQAVQALTQFYKILPSEILVAHDELDLLPGTAKLKLGGGHGGHNGLRDIIAQLGNQRDFRRLRVGIGHPGHASEVVNFVLGRPPQSERQLTEKAIDEAVKYTDIMTVHWQKAMTHMNQFMAE